MYIPVAIFPILDKKRKQKIKRWDGNMLEQF